MGLKQVLSPTGSLQPPASSASNPDSALRPTRLGLDLDFYVNPVTGDDATNGQVATPWRSIARFHSFVESFQSIAGTLRCFIVGATATPAVMTELTCPPLDGGKLVYLGSGATVVATIVAAAGSDQTVVLTNDAIGVDVAGCQLVCTAGDNIGLKRTIGQYVAGAPSSLAPASNLTFAGVGDTWQVVRPSQRVTWADGIVLMGARGGGAIPGESADDGVYFSNLVIEGSPRLAQSDVYLFGVESSAGGCTVQAGTRLLAGRAAGDMPWLGILDASIARGWGYSQRRLTHPPTAGAVLVNQESDSYVGGYVAGCRWAMRESLANGWLMGGMLWGGFQAEAVEVSAPGCALLIGFDTVTLSMGSTAAGVVRCERQGYIEMTGCTLDGGADGTTLLRATGLGTIYVSGALAGSTTGIAQDASGAGNILWDLEPAITGTVADLAVESVTASNSALAAAPAIVEDATGLSWIARRVPVSFPVTPPTSLPLASAHNAIPILAVIPANTPTVIVPAPPAGYVNVLQTLRLVTGADATVAIVSDAVGLLTRRSVAANTTQALQLGQTVCFYSEGAITAELVAAAIGGTVDGYAVQMPKPAGLYQAYLALTNVFAAVPGAAPAAQAAIPLGSGVISTPLFTGTGDVLINGDSAASTIQFRLTRGATVQTWQETSLAANSLRSLTAPALLAGDTLEARTTVAPVTAGAVAVRLGWLQVPQV